VDVTSWAAHGGEGELRVGLRSGEEKAAAVPSAAVIDQRREGGGELSPERQAQLEAERKAQDQAIRDRKCSAYRTDLIELKDQQRGGGSASSMDRLNRKKREIEKNIVDTCV
jgi:hypothetical protein